MRGRAVLLDVGAFRQTHWTLKKACLDIKAPVAFLISTAAGSEHSWLFPFQKLSLCVSYKMVKWNVCSRWSLLQGRHITQNFSLTCVNLWQLKMYCLWEMSKTRINAQEGSKVEQVLEPWNWQEGPLKRFGEADLYLPTEMLLGLLLWS